VVCTPFSGIRPIADRAQEQQGLARRPASALHHQYSPIFLIVKAFVPPTCPIGSPQVTTMVSPRSTTPLSSKSFSAAFNTSSRSVDCANSSVCTLRYSADLRCVAIDGVMAKMGTSMLWRLIHSEVEPDSVK